MDSIVWQQYKLVLSSENVAGLKFSQEKDWEKYSINNPQRLCENESTLAKKATCIYMKEWKIKIYEESGMFSLTESFVPM